MHFRRTSRAPRPFLAAAGLALWCCSGPLQAQTPSPLGEWQYSAGIVLKQRFDLHPPHWEELVGFGGEMLPRFEGSDRYYFEPGPTIDIRYRNLAFFSTGEGLGINLLRNVNYRAGVALTYDLGRQEGNDIHLRGLGDVSPSPELKFFGEYVFFPLIVRADVRSGFGGHGGWIGDVSAYAPVAGSDKFFVFIGGSVTMAEDDYMRHEYGVDQTQHQQSGLPLYAPGGGVKAAGVGTNATWIFREHWFVDAVFGASLLLGPAAGSPTVDEKMQMAFSLSLAYDFR